MTHFPLTGWQDYLRKLEQDPVGNHGLVRQFTISEATQIRPSIGDRRIRRAFDALVARHDILRSRYVQQRGRWMLEIPERHPLGLEIVDFGEVAAAEIPGLARERARRLVGMSDPACVRIELLKCGSQGDVLILRIHHGVVDGFGFIVALEDFLSLLLGRPLIGQALSYAGYMARWGKDPQTSADLQFWENKLRDAPPPLNIGRVQKGMPILHGNRAWTRGKTCQVELTDAQMEQIEDAAKTAGVTPFMLSNAAYLQTVGAYCGADEVLYSATLGRSDAALAKFAGHHTLHPLLILRGLRSGTLTDVARAATADFAETLAHLPAPAARRTGSWDERLIEAGCYPRQVTTGSMTATARIAGSPFASSMNQPAGESQRIGRFTLTKIKMPYDPGGFDELNFRPFYLANSSYVNASYDADAIEDDMMVAFLDETFDRLGIRKVNKRLLDKVAVAAK